MFNLPLSEDLPDLEALSTAVVSGNSWQPMIGRKTNIEEHINGLQSEFVGMSQLMYFHAALNVLIRRKIDLELAVHHFNVIWTLRRKELLRGLSARWLVSACDTIMDYSQDSYERAMACAASTLMNTVKLYETERLACDTAGTSLPSSFRPVPIFDGMTSFSIGKGDMIINLRERTESVCMSRLDSAAADIMLEALHRIDTNDTIYRRLAAVHEKEQTRWTPL